MAESIVRAENLSKAYGNIRAVDHIDFCVEPGECFGILGPNGAGKSTTMKMLYGRTPISDGILRIFGLDARHQMSQIKGLMGIIPQEDNLDPDFTVEQNLWVYGGYFRIPKNLLRERITELIDFMQLDNKREARIDALSGGMKRRLIIARALLNNPRLIILDEPTTGLDPQARALVWQKMRELRNRGITMVLTTHYMEEADNICDRLMVMDEGKIVAQGTPKGLITQFADHWIVEIRDLTDAVMALVRNWDRGLCFEGHGEMRVFVPSIELAVELYHHILHEVRPEKVRYRPTNLEDVFSIVTGHTLQTEAAEL